MKKKEFGFKINIKCEKEVSEIEIMKMMNNISARLEGYNTEPPEFLGKYQIGLSIDYDVLKKENE